MCKASVAAKFVTDAKPGESYRIGISSHYLGAFHPAGKTTSECVACVKDGMQLTLSSIPRKLQKKYGIGATETVIFSDTGDNAQDELDFQNGRTGFLDEFANRGVTAYVCVPATATSPTPSPEVAETPDRTRELVAA